MSATQINETPIIPVILAGGSGTRLWPLSRRLFPKQFLSLGSEHSLIQRTAMRCRALPGATTPVVVASEEHRFLVQDHMSDVGFSDCRILLEPSARNTAPAIAAVSAWALSEYGPDAALLVMPADHVMASEESFAEIVTGALAEMRKGRLVTFGVTPDRPETGYGYIRMGEALDTPDMSEVRAFVEKPDEAKAQSYLEAGDYVWNSGMFLFGVGAMLEELEAHEAEMVEHARQAVLRARHDGPFVRLAAEPFMACRSDSIDYAVMERSSHIVVARLPVDTGWDDVGSWAYLDRMPHDGDSANKLHGDVHVIDGSGNLVLADGRLVSLVGVDDLVVVETRDSVLVTRRECAQDVKEVVGWLRENDRDESELHPRVYRPWGFYETISGGDRFQCKRIMVRPGEKLSSQMHHHRSEHWVVVRGTAVVTIDGEETLLSENQSTYIPLGKTHRLYNPGKVSLELIEVQSGSYLGEDDIVRFDDLYGRDPGTEAQADPAPQRAHVA